MIGELALTIIYVIVESRVHVRADNRRDARGRAGSPSARSRRSSAPAARAWSRRLSRFRRSAAMPRASSACPACATRCPPTACSFARRPVSTRCTARRTWLFFSRCPGRRCSCLSGSYEQLFTYVTFASVLFFVAGGLSIFKLRHSHAARAAPVPHMGISGSAGSVCPGFGDPDRQHAARTTGGVDWRAGPGRARTAGLLVSADEAVTACRTPLNTQMRFAILGSGAVGGYYGASLALRGPA